MPLPPRAALGPRGVATMVPGVSTIMPSVSSGRGWRATWDSRSGSGSGSRPAASRSSRKQSGLVCAR